MRKIIRIFLTGILFCSLSACRAKENNPEETSTQEPGITADVLSVLTGGEAGAYTFTVQVSSPDLGCEQYADWWEVLDEEGNLLFRRILTHSHVDEQPFTRSGGPVPIQPEQKVWVRAHLHTGSLGNHTGGYGGGAFFGSVLEGFTEQPLDPDFAPGAAGQKPLPEDCAF